MADRPTETHEDRTADLKFATQVECKIAGPIRNQMFASSVGQVRSTDAGQGGGSNTQRLRGTEAYHKAPMAVNGNREKGKDKGKGNDKGKDNGKDNQ